MKHLIIFLLLVSCASNINGPNYNQGKSHNKNRSNRQSIVLKEDSRMKNSMNKARVKATKRNEYNKYKRKKPNRRLV